MIRTILTSDLNIYINASLGNDQTGDGSSTNPFKTLQFAHDYVQKNYDLGNSWSVYYNAVGAFTSGITEWGPLVGQCNPINQVFRFPESSSVICASPFGASYSIGYMIESTNGGVTISGSVGVQASSGSTICINGGITFGPCTTSAIQTAWGGNIYVNGNLSIYGNGAQFLFASGGVIQLDPGFTMTWIEPTTYSNCCVWAYGQGVIGINGQTFVGSVYGCKYKAELLGLIATGTMNPNYLPGSTPGGVSFGGIYW